MPKFSVNDNKKTICFITHVCICCALLLSVLSSSLKKTQLQSAEIERNKQMLIAAQLLSFDGKWILEEGKVRSRLISKKEIQQLYKMRVKSFLVNEQGEQTTFEELGIDERDYLLQQEKEEFSSPWKVIYAVFSPPKEEGQQFIVGYIIPISGFGLWDAIYGYLAVKENGQEVMGTTWYKHGETPGLGANIASLQWQQQFPGKTIFQIEQEGENLAQVPLGITLIKGKVNDLPLHSPKRKFSVDGLPGATVTSQGVSQAYRNSLEPYRSFLLSLQKP